MTANYFKVLKVPLVQGRFLDERDTADAPKAVVINQAFARKWFPNQEAVGKKITFDDPRKPDPKWITIVGSVGDMRHHGLDVEAKPEYYLPHPQNPYRGMILAVRSKQDPRSLAESIRREIRQGAGVLFAPDCENHSAVRVLRMRQIILRLRFDIEALVVHVAKDRANNRDPLFFFFFFFFFCALQHLVPLRIARTPDSGPAPGRSPSRPHLRRDLQRDADRELALEHRSG